MNMKTLQSKNLKKINDVIIKLQADLGGHLFYPCYGKQEYIDCGTTVVAFRVVVLFWRDFGTPLNSSE